LFEKKRCVEPRIGDRAIPSSCIVLVIPTNENFSYRYLSIYGNYIEVCLYVKGESSILYSSFSITPVRPHKFIEKIVMSTIRSDSLPVFKETRTVLLACPVRPFLFASLGPLPARPGDNAGIDSPSS